MIVFQERRGRHAAKRSLIMLLGTALVVSLAIQAFGGAEIEKKTCNRQRAHAKSTHEGRDNKMRKVILALQVTLDGFIEGPKGELGWAMKEDEETWKDVFELQRPADTLLLGRMMYPAFEKYWLAAPTNPSSTKNEIEYARLADNMQKIVFSKSLEKVEWKTTRIIKDHIAEEILKMKQQPGKDMVLLGGTCVNVYESRSD